MSDAICLAMTAGSFNILINAMSGTVLDMGEAAIRAAIEDSALSVSELRFSQPADMQDNLLRLASQPGHLLVGGGDGTIRDSAARLADTGTPFGILPFGTMNLLAHDLGIDTLQGALTGYAAGVTTQAIDAGFVNGEIFLCCASIGTMPQASAYREKNRLSSNLLLFPQLLLFVLRNFELHRRDRVTVEVDGTAKRFHTPAVVVSVNRFADSLSLTESNFKRATLTGGELAAYVFTANTHVSHLRFLWRLIVGHWLKDPDLTEIAGQEVQLRPRHNRPLVSVDGEILRLRTPLAFSLKPGYVQVLMPNCETP